MAIFNQCQHVQSLFFKARGEEFSAEQLRGVLRLGAFFLFLEGYLNRNWKLDSDIIDSTIADISSWI